MLSLEDDRVITPPQFRKNVFMVCLALRCMLGVLTVTGIMPSWLLVTMSSILIFIFYNKATSKDTWKAYWKTVYIYSSVLAITLYKKESTQAAGVLMIMEAMFGLTTRDLYDKIIKYS